MVIDSSAIAAILFSEPEASAFEQKIADDPIRLISAATLLEVSIIIESRLGVEGGREFELWLVRAGVEVMSVDSEQADIARRGWRRFGKGRHPASLNYGDCFTYALAIARDESVLFKGDDFAKTDVKRCA
jgi:ribonuclease VapC